MRVVLALLVVALAGCAVPHDLRKQAEEVSSVAAEGALLAHEASEGSLDAFTTEHAKALRKRLAELRPAIEDERLGEVADDVDRTLAELAAKPGDEERAAGAERKFDDLAAAADELAG